MAADAILIGACVASIGGVAFLRAAWSLQRRSLALNAAGWALLLGGAVAGWIAEGAWGTSIAALAAMTAAFAVLAWSGAASRPGRQAASNRRVRMLPETGEALRIGARLLTFVLVALASAIVAIGIAVAVCGAADLLGWSEANCNAAALFAMPIAWSIIAYAVLVQPRRIGQWKVLLIASLPAWPALAAGALA